MLTICATYIQQRINNNIGTNSNKLFIINDDISYEKYLIQIVNCLDASKMFNDLFKKLKKDILK